MVESNDCWDERTSALSSHQNTNKSHPQGSRPNPGQHRHRQLTETLAIVALFVILMARLIVWVPRWWKAGVTAESDFTFYYLAGWRLRLGLSPYGDLLSVKEWAGLPPAFGWASDPHFPPVGNPPPLLYLFLPLTWLPYEEAWLVWSALSFLAAVCAVVLLWRSLLPRLPLSQLALGMFAVLGFTPWLHHIRWGRAESLVLLALVGSLVSLRQGREVWAGALTGLAACLRVYPGLLCLYLLVTHRWRATAASVGAAVLLCGATLVPRGLQDYRAPLRYVLPALNERFLLSTASVSISSVLSQLHEGGLPFTSLAIRMIQALLLCAALGACWRTHGRTALGYGLMVVTALLCSPITWYHSLILLAVPLLALASLGLSSRALRVAVGAIYLACCWDQVVIIEMPWPLLSTLLSLWPFYGLVALYAVLVVLLWRSPSRVGLSSLLARVHAGREAGLDRVS